MIGQAGFHRTPSFYPNQSRVRVRRASISEPSDTDPDLRTLDPSPAGNLTLLTHSFPDLSSLDVASHVGVGGET